jgi:hypothetical protein
MSDKKVRNVSKNLKQEDSKQEQRKKPLQQKQSKSQKDGGAFVTDVKNLAVPFAILLAKEGVSKYFKGEKTADKKKTPSSSKTSSSNASKSSSASRRRTMAGGSCNLGCGALTGGAAGKQLVQLQQQIDNFLEKY